MFGGSTTTDGIGGEMFMTSIAGNSSRSIWPSVSSGVDAGFACGRRKTAGKSNPVV